METLHGFIGRIVYRKPENGYTVLNLVTDEGTVPCVGFFRVADEGENLEVTGDYTMHPMYGRQFQIEKYEIKSPDDITSMERYLGSGAIKGIGESLAKRIIKEFGEDTFRVMEEEPELLARVKGISDKKAREIGIQFIEKQSMRNAMIFLQEYGISNTLAIKIYEEYGMNCYQIIRENPYLIAEDISGVGFKTADEIAERVGINPDSDYRIRCGILYVLQLALQDGHCYLPKEIIEKNSAELLGVDTELVWTHIMNLAMDKKLVIKSIGDDVKVYDKKYYYMELSCAKMILDLDIDFDGDDEAIKRKIDILSKNKEIVLEDIQKEAVYKAVKKGVIIITGGPGTGKTTIINTILDYYEAEGMDVCLAAPTGRAAKRMTETTGYEASTIQRLLRLVPTSDDENTRSFKYEVNDENPLETDVVIIDEMSMVDLPLYYALLKAIMVGTSLIMVGDINQLQSVGPGSVLKDLIVSEKLEVVRLKKIFRQAENSDIVVNAHRINNGERIRLDNKSKDFFFLQRDDINVIMKHMITFINDKLPKYVKADPFDIQVLTPMRKGPLGVENLNPILQKYLNPPDINKDEKEHGDTVFRVGDKVMQIKNNYQLEWEIQSKYGIPIDKGLGVFNGDMGIVVEIDSYLEEMVVEYEEKRKVRYPFSLLDELELAYAVTIHKSQGSEYPAVIIPLLVGPRMLFNRNLLYTGVTRAKSCVVILGSEERINFMIDNATEAKRYTTLSERINELFDSDI